MYTPTQLTVTSKLSLISDLMLRYIARHSKFIFNLEGCLCFKKRGSSSIEEVAKPKKKRGAGNA